MGAIIIIIALVAISELLSGLNTTSASQRSAVVAQNLATKELGDLRAQAAATGGFPPSDASQSPATLAGSSLSQVSTYTLSGTTYTTFAVGGYCTNTSATASGVTTGTWATYSSAPSESSPADYFVGVVVVWGPTNKASSTLSVSTSPPDHVVSSLRHLIIVSSVAIPTTDDSDTPSSSSDCPAMLT